MSAEDSENEPDPTAESEYSPEPDSTHPKTRNGDDDRDDDAEDRAADDADATEARSEVAELSEQVGLEESAEGAATEDTDEAADSGEGERETESGGESSPSTSDESSGAGSGSVAGASGAASGAGEAESAESTEGGTAGSSDGSIPTGSEVVLEDGTEGVVSYNAPSEDPIEISTDDGFQVIDPEQVASYQLPEGHRQRTEESPEPDEPTEAERRGQHIRENSPLPTDPDADAIPDDFDRLSGAWYDRYTSEFTRWVDHEDMTEEEYLDAKESELEELVSDADLRVRVQNPFVLSQILDSGRLKTQFETHESGGMYKPDIRAQFEATAMGYDEDIPPERRPVYGYLGEPPDTDAMFSGGPQSRLAHYGNTVIRLKDDVRERTTFTVGDSLNTSVVDDESRVRNVPSKLTDPDVTAVEPNSLAEPFSDITERDSLSGSGKYVEAQYHGGITVGDIEEVIFRRDDEPTDELKERLEQAGIPWESRTH